MECFGGKVAVGNFGESLSGLTMGEMAVFVIGNSLVF